MRPVTILAFAFAMAPTLVAAQQAPAPDAQAFPHPNMAAMEQMHAQMKQLHLQARAQILGALTPAHRALLANIAGQLAIAPNPNREAAAAALDRALTPAEGRTILAAQANERTQVHAMMESARAQFEASLTPAQKAAMSARMANRPQIRTESHMEEHGASTDPGRTLLNVALGHGGDRMFFGMRAGPGGALPPPQ